MPRLYVVPADYELGESDFNMLSFYAEEFLELHKSGVMPGIFTCGERKRWRRFGLIELADYTSRGQSHYRYLLSSRALRYLEGVWRERGLV